MTSQINLISAGSDYSIYEHLETLSFPEVDGNDENSVEALTKTIVHCTNLKNLTLAGSLKDHGIIAISQALAGKNLKSLSLQAVCMTDEGLKALSESLKGMPGLTKLNIQYNNVTDEGLKSLAPALKGKMVTHLLVEGTQFTPQGMANYL